MVDLAKGGRTEDGPLKNYVFDVAFCDPHFTPIDFSKNISKFINSTYVLLALLVQHRVGPPLLFAVRVSDATEKIFI